MEIYKDGVNAERYAEDYKIETIEINKNAEVVAQMSSGGGWVAIISKKSAE